MLFCDFGQFKSGVDRSIQYAINTDHDDSQLHLTLVTK